MFAFLPQLRHKLTFREERAVSAAGQSLSSVATFGAISWVFICVSMWSSVSAVGRRDDSFVEGP